MQKHGMFEALQIFVIAGAASAREDVKEGRVK